MIPSSRYPKPYGRRAPRDALEFTDPDPPVFDIEHERPTWKAFWDAVHSELRLRFYRPKSIKTYRIALRLFARSVRKQPHEVTAADLRAFLTAAIDDGRSRAWVALLISAVRTAFDKFGGMTVASGIRAPRKSRRLPVILSEEQILILLLAIRQPRDKALIGLMYACGLRVSEVCRLRWCDFDLDRRVIRINDAKGGKDRYVALPEAFHVLARRAMKVRTETDYVFRGRNDKHITTRFAQIILKRAVTAAGLPKNVTCHTLRHAFATHLLEHGLDVRLIQELLGHHRLETTRIYTHVARTDAIKWASPLDRVMPLARTGEPTTKERILPPPPPAPPPNLPPTSTSNKTQ